MIRSICLILTIGLIIISCTTKNSTTSETSTSPEVVESIKRGELVYNQNCVVCHMKDGLGAPPMNPPLSKTSFVIGDKTVLINIVLNGLSNTEVDGTKYYNPMPALSFLTDEKIADVLTYIRNNFDNKASAISPNDVKSARK